MSNKTMNSKDKNSIIQAIVLISMIALAVAFFKLSRNLPFIFIIIGILVLEFLYVLPQLCDKYFKLFGAEAGFGKYVPFLNILMILPSRLACLCTCITILLALLWYLAVGPMFWVTASNFAFFAEIQDAAFGWAMLCTIIWSLVVGMAFIAVIKDVNEMRAEFCHTSVPRIELVNYVMVALPFARCFVLFNLLNSINFLLRSGYEYGKDYSEVEFEEDDE